MVDIPILNVIGAVDGGPEVVGDHRGDIIAADLEELVDGKTVTEVTKDSFHELTDGRAVGETAIEGFETLTGFTDTRGKGLAKLREDAGGTAGGGTGTGGGEVGDTGTETGDEFLEVFLEVFLGDLRDVTETVEERLPVMTAGTGEIEDLGKLGVDLQETDAGERELAVGDDKLELLTEILDTLTGVVDLRTPVEDFLRGLQEHLTEMVETGDDMTLNGIVDMLVVVVLLTVEETGSLQRLTGGELRGEDTNRIASGILITGEDIAKVRDTVVLLIVLGTVAGSEEGSGDIVVVNTDIAVGKEDGRTADEKRQQ